MANPFPFVANTVLTAAQLNGIGEYTAYTPTLSGVTLGNGTLAFRFGRVQNFIHVYGTLTLGTTSSVTGQIQVGVPVAAASSGNVSHGLSRFKDTGTADFQGVAGVDFSTSFAALQTFTVSGTFLARGGTSATAPFTWASTDVISANYIYEAA
jgi:hypothetical protein